MNSKNHSTFSNNNEGDLVYISVNGDEEDNKQVGRDGELYSTEVVS